MSDDEYLTRVAVHGSIPDDVPEGTKVTNKELDAVVEILYIRANEEYWVLSRRRQTLYLDHGGGPFDEFEAALDSAIETAHDEGSLLRRIYSWAPESDADELGSDHIPIPWANDEYEDDSDQ